MTYSQVAGHLAEIRRRRRHHARCLDEAVHVRCAVQAVFRACKAVARELAEPFDHAEHVVARRANARAHRRPAQVDDPQPLLALVGAPTIARECVRVGPELRAEHHRHGVLPLRAPDRDDAGERALAILRRALNRREVAAQRPHRRDRRDPHRGGNRVICRLVQVHMLDRVDRPVLASRPAQQLERSIGEHLVHVHVQRGARAALQRVDGKLIRPPPFDHLVARLRDRVGHRGLEIAELPMGQRRGLFHQREPADDRGMDRPAAQRKVPERARRVDAPQRLRRNRQFAEGIALDSRRPAGMESAHRHGANLPQPFRPRDRPPPTGPSDMSNPWTVNPAARPIVGRRAALGTALYRPRAKYGHWPGSAGTGVRMRKVSEDAAPPVRHPRRWQPQPCSRDRRSR